ncbi:MAG: hypothetical protein QOK43_2471 [Acidimicrobiaceae bacterium]|nr:hypothetical protein [Acidimicrobiaceae bacterium]
MMRGMDWGRRNRTGALATMAAIALAAGVVGSGCGRSGSAKPKPVTQQFRSGAASQPGGVTVTSNAFGEGAHIPERYSCKGDNVAPPITWKGVPPGMSSVAVAVTDPDAPRGLFVHWLVTSIPPTPTGSLSPAVMPPGAKDQKNSAGQAGYTGMCPPAGQSHHYLFEVIVLPGPVTLPEDPAAAVRALRAAARASGKLTGTFGG